MKRLRLVLLAASLTGLMLVPSSLQAATLNVPKSPWPVCSSTIVTYCVQSVSIQSPGQAPEQLTWVPSGTSNPGTTTTTSTSTTTTSSPSATTTTTPSGPTLEGGAVPGYWTDTQWTTNGHGSLGFGGIYVKASAANVFSNYMLFNVLPAIQDPTSNNVFVADQPASGFQASLNPDDLITVSLDTGDAQSGVSMALANNFSDVIGTDASGTTLSFTASPVPIAIASDTSQCVDETGVAAAQATELQVIVAPTNDPTAGFGVDGVSGRMFVESNGACSLSTPVWDATAQTLSWTVAAPHFLSDRSTTNTGFYEAVIPGSDAVLLWGLTNVNQAASALIVSETSTGGSSNTAISSVSVKNGNVIISSTGFAFSRPKFKISRNPKYKFGPRVKKSTISCVRGKAVKRVSGYSPKCPAGFKKLVTISCVKGKSLKRVTGVSPRCPQGYKRH